MNNFNQELIKLIKNGVSPFNTCLYIKDILEKEGYEELKENEKW